MVSRVMPLMIFIFLLNVVSIVYIYRKYYCNVAFFPISKQPDIDTNYHTTQTPGTSPVDYAHEHLTIFLCLVFFFTMY